MESAGRQPRRSRSGFAAVCTLACLAGASFAIERGASMAGMGGTPMPGGWTLSMAWTRMCGQDWPDAAGSFLAMWMAMMVSMMAPVLAHALWRYDRGVPAASTARVAGLTLQVAAAYLLVWGLTGVAVYTVGAWLAGIEMRSPAIARLVPLGSALLLAAAGAMQLTAWKERQLGHCRTCCAAPLPLRPDARSAWRYGRHLGWHCLVCCTPLTIAMLMLGVMDLRVMGAVATAIAAERLAPAARHFARLSGVAMLAAGAVLASGAFA